MASSPTAPPRKREPKPVVYPCQLVILVDVETDAAVRQIVADRRAKRQAGDSIAAVLREMVSEGVEAHKRRTARAAKGRAYASGKGATSA